MMSEIEMKAMREDLAKECCITKEGMIKYLQETQPLEFDEKEFFNLLSYFRTNLYELLLIEKMMKDKNQK